MDIASLVGGGASGGRGSRRNTAREETRTRNTYEQHEYSQPVTRDGYTVLAIMLMETGTYNPEFLRPYSVSVDRNDITTIGDIAEENHGMMMSPDLLAGVAGRVLRYSSEVTKRDLVDIENGWDTKRLSFLIEVIEDSRPDFEYTSSNSETVTYISGWTDRLDIVETRDGVAPPNDLVFYVSNVHRIERQTKRIQTNHQLIVPSYHAMGYGGNDRNDLYVVRPRDVFNDEMSKQVTPANSRRLNTSNRLHGTMPKTSRSSNLLPSSYISSSINAYVRGETQRNSMQDGYGNYDANRQQGRESVYSKASSLLSESTAYERNSFMYLLRQQSSEFSARTTFTWGDLTDIFTQDILRVTSMYKRKAVERRDNSRSRWASAGESSNWDNNTNHGYNAVFATALKQSLPGYALESKIYSCRIEATNIISASEERFHSIHGILITVSDVVFIARMPNAHEENILIDQMKSNIASHILRDVSLDNTIDFDIVVDLDWRNDSFIHVGIEGGEMVEFSTSSFSNSLTPPIITTNPDFTDNMVNDLRAVVNEILERKTR